MLNFKEANKQLNSIPGIMEETLNYYGIKKARVKDKYECPFCGSKDNLHLYKDNYYCFGKCARKYYPVNIVMEKEDIPYTEAIKVLAVRYGIEIPNMELTEEERIEFEKRKEEEKKKRKTIFKLEEAAKTSKDITRKFELSCLADNIENDADSEKMNHANYIANEKYDIEKYIGEHHHFTVLNMLLDDRDTLAIAPPGSGKSREIIEVCKKYNIKAIFVLPLAANVEQTAITYSINAAYDKLDLISAIERSDNIVVCTWNKLEQLKNYDISEYKIILDEVHQIYTDMYREKAIDTMLRIIKRGKSRLDVTATPTMLDFSEYENIVEFIPTKKPAKNIYLYDNTDTKTVLNIVNNPSNKSMVLINNKNILNMLAEQTNEKCDVITTDTKHSSELYKLLMNDSTMGDYKVLYHTSTLLASYNIKDTDITDIVIFAENELKNVPNIIQDIARPRNVDNIRVHIFGKFKEECNVYDINWLIKKDIKSWQDVAKIYNKSISDEFTTLKIEVNAGSSNDSYIYFDKEIGEYAVNKVKVRADIYRKYYNSRTIESFATLLEEYIDFNLDTIDIIREVEEQQTELIKDTRKANKETKEAAIDLLANNKEILVGYNDIIKGNITCNLYNYMVDNSLTEEYLIKQYEENNIKEAAAISNKILDLYTKYVLDYGYSYDLAWTLANMHHNTRISKFENPIRNIIYNKISTEYPGEVVESIDNKVYDYIVENIKPGMTYTTEHIELLSNDLIDKFLDSKKYSVDGTRKLLSEIFSITSKQCKKSSVGTGVNFNFYIKEKFIGVPKDRFRVYTIEGLMSIEHIKEQLNLNENDRSIENAITKRIDNILNKYNNEKLQEIELINELFNVC